MSRQPSPRWIWAFDFVMLARKRLAPLVLHRIGGDEIVVPARVVSPSGGYGSFDVLCEAGLLVIDRAARLLERIVENYFCGRGRRGQSSMGGDGRERTVCAQPLHAWPPALSADGERTPRPGRYSRSSSSMALDSIWAIVLFRAASKACGCIHSTRPSSMSTLRPFW